jgi:ribosome-binding factor A
MTQRTERIDELLRQEIGSILARELKDPRVGFATVTRVETAPDLRHARVWVSVIGQHGERAETIAALDRAMGFIRHELGDRLRLRRIPELHVRLDDTMERGTRVLRLLDELEAGRTPVDEVAPGEETLPTPLIRVPHEGDLLDEPPSAAEPPPSARLRGRRRDPRLPGSGPVRSPRDRGERPGRSKR